MKLHHSEDETGVTFSERDKDIVRAGSEAVDSLVNLTESIGRRECEWCDGRGRLRPYQLTVDGEFTVLHICADCQADFVKDAKAQETGDDDATPGLEADDGGRKEAIERELDPDDLPPADGSDTVEGEGDE